MGLIEALKPLASGCLQRVLCLNLHILPGAAGPRGSEPAGGARVGGCGGGGSLPPSPALPFSAQCGPKRPCTQSVSAGTQGTPLGGEGCGLDSPGVNPTPGEKLSSVFRL